MWKQLPDSQKRIYEKLITNFASLSEAFAQKSDNDSNNGTIVPPIIYSKFQETAFQRAFNATGEDIGNTSYDASVDYTASDVHKKYLVGIKTFGINSGNQKIAQFKAVSASSWTDIIDNIKENAKGLNDKQEIDKINNDLYLKLAKKIARIRNARIKSSEENIKGLNDRDENNGESKIKVEAVYHVLMPTPKNTEPKIFVGETSYLPIDIDKIEIDGCTGPKNPTNFTFRDSNHVYKYTSSDSQLLMAFDNNQIIKEVWDVQYVDDALSFLKI